MTPEAKEFLNRIDDKVEIVLERHQEQVTEFVDPYLRNVAENYLKKISGLNFLSFGGVNDAERQRIVICPDYLQPQPEMAKISIVELTGKLGYIEPSHRDFLGALLGQGIKREKVGDLYIIAGGCVIILSEELADYVLLNPPKIKGASLTATQYQVGQWQPDKPEGKEINTSVSSLRLDTIVANGFGISRTKVTGFIKGGKVKVNWRIIEDVDFHCQVGDTISFRGKGRIIVDQIGGNTKKGRVKIRLIRYK